MEILDSTPTVSPDKYLEFERASNTRHEYVDGQVYLKPDICFAHSQICVNAIAEISRALKGSHFEVLSPNMKVRTKTKEVFAYPDLSVVCGEPMFHDANQDVLLNPKVIIEVLSPSTQRYDQTKKFFRYRKEILSLTDYILIYQDVAFAEHHAKNDEGKWEHNGFDGLGDTFRIPSINCEIPMTEIYDRVDFATANSFPKA